jgi:hypothetical protein
MTHQLSLGTVGVMELVMLAHVVMAHVVMLAVVLLAVVLLAVMLVALSDQLRSSWPTEH